jgi:hypothetical protein
MESINLELFASHELSKKQGSLIRGGTGAGSKTLGAGSCDSVVLSWGSDTSNGNGGYTYHGSSTCDDEND